MMRSVLSLVVVAGLVGSASAYCRRPGPQPVPIVIAVPSYPLTPAIWGAPAPPPLPPYNPPVIKPKPAIREESETPPAKTQPQPEQKNGEKPKEEKPREEKPKEDTPKIPKTKLPLPGDPPAKDTKENPPKLNSESKGEPRAFDQYLVPADTRPTGEPSTEVKVGFFNHSSRELILVVNNEEVKLPASQYVTLRLPRSFQWSEKGNKSANLTVPADADGLEIVFRK